MSLRDWWAAVLDLFDKKPRPRKARTPRKLRWSPRHTWGPQEERPEGPPPKDKR